MSGEFWRDLVSLVLITAGALFSLVAGIGLLRFGDLLQRLHAQSKPQSAGLMFILIGLAVQQNGLAPVLMLVPVLVFQFLTTPTAGIVLARGGYRSKHFEDVPLHIDELEDEVARAQRAADVQARREEAAASHE